MSMFSKGTNTVIKALAGAAALGAASKLGEGIMDGTGLTQKVAEVSKDTLASLSGVVDVVTDAAVIISGYQAPTKLGGTPPVGKSTLGRLPPATPATGTGRKATPATAATRVPVIAAAPAAGVRTVCAHELAEGLSLAGSTDLRIVECQECGEKARDLATHQREMTLGWAKVWKISDEVKETVPAVEDPRFTSPSGFLARDFYAALAGWQEETFTALGVQFCGPQPVLSTYTGYRDANRAGKAFQQNLTMWNRCRSGNCGPMPQMSDAAYVGFDNAAEAGHVYQNDVNIWTNCNQHRGRRRGGGGQPAVVAAPGPSVVVAPAPGPAATSPYPYGSIRADRAVANAQRQAAQAKAALSALQTSNATQIQSLKDKIQLTNVVGDKRVLQQKLNDLMNQQGALGTLQTQFVAAPQNPAVLALMSQLATQAQLGPAAVLTQVQPMLTQLVAQVPQGAPPQAIVETMSTLMPPASPVVVTAPVDVATPMPTVPWQAPAQPGMDPSDVKRMVDQEVTEAISTMTDLDNDGGDDDEYPDYAGVVDPELNAALGLSGIEGLTVDSAVEAFASAGAGWDPVELAEKLADEARENGCSLGACRGV